MSTNYQGSQAFIQSSASTEAINPNTGSVSFNKRLLALRGPSPSSGVTVTLSFAQGSMGAYGLPNGWSLNLPYVVKNGPQASSLTFQSSTYSIDPEWNKEFNIDTGLAYVNTKGVRFSQFTNENLAPLSKRNAPYTYTTGDGRTWYFDATGRLIEWCDLFGVGMVVTYRAGDTTPANALIDTLQIMVSDGAVAQPFGMPLVFSYSGGNSLALLLNAKNVTQFQWDLQGVRTISEGGTVSTTITPQVIHGQNAINTIQYWNGLKTEFLYQDIPYYDGSLSTVNNFVAAQSHRHWAPDGSLLGRTDYAFGADDGKTFTGYEQKLLIQQANDVLIEAALPGYSYGVSILQTDEKGTAQARTEVTYNSFHAPIQTDFYSNPTAVAPTYRLLNSYDRVGKDALTSRTFNLPISKEASVLSSTQTTVRIQQTTQTLAYTDYGKVAQKITFAGDGTTIIKQENHAYSETADTRSIPAQSTFYDGVLNQSLRCSYTFNDAQTTVMTITRDSAGGGPYDSASTAAWQGWKTTAMTYDTLGRVATRTASWSDTYSGDRGALTSATVSYDYAVQDNAFVVTLTNALGASSISTYDLTLPSGPLATFQDADKALTSYHYDGIGRLVSSTDPSGLTTNYAYLQAGVGATGDAVNTTTSTNTANGYQIVCVTDPLDRAVRLTDNGTGTQTLSATADRLLRQQVFDVAGNLAQSVDELHRTTAYTYDGMGRMLSKTLPDQSIATLSYDDEAGACLTSIGDVVVSVHRSDPLGRSIGTDIYPAVGPTSTAEPISYQTTYSGSGQALSHTLLTLPAGTAGTGTPPTGTIQSTSQKTYDPDGKLVSLTQQTADSADGHSLHSFTRDLLGNVVSVTRTVTDAQGTTTTTASGTYTFDAAGMLRTIDDGVGGTEQRDYTAAGRLSKLTLPNGAFQYGYQNGNLSRIDLLEDEQNPSGVFIGYNLDPAGRLTTVSTEVDQITYDYTPDGALWSVTYPQGAAVSLVLDHTSRITTATDPNGISTTTTFDTLGRLSTRAQNGTTLTFNYDDTDQRLETIAVTGAQAGSLSFTYDDFGTPSGSTLTNTSGDVLLAVTVAKDWAGRLKALSLRSDTLPDDPTANMTAEFAYDAIGRLSKRTITPVNGSPATTSYTFDAAGNMTAENGPDGDKSFSYNAFNQCQDGAVFDANGRMTDDGHGNHYTFDSWDRLTSLNSPDGQSDFNYWPDGSLKSVVKNGQTQAFGYLGGAITSSVQNGKTTGLLRGFGTVHATIDKDSGGATLLGTANGSTCLIYDGSTSLAVGYGPFGTASPPPPQSTPSWRQELLLGGSSLCYLRARWHSPALGRFISADPSIQLNRYAYSDGDPNNQADPTGLMPAWLDTLLVIGLAVGLEILTDGVASYIFADEAEEIGAEQASISADKAALKSDQDLLGSLKKLPSSGDDAVSRSVQELEDSTSKDSASLSDREQSLKQRRLRLGKSLLKYKVLTAPVASVTEDLLHRVIKGEPIDGDALKSFGLDIVLSLAFVGFSGGGGKVEKGLGEVVEHAIRQVPATIMKAAISSSVHRQFGLGGLSYIPPISALYSVIGVVAPSRQQGHRLDELVGSPNVPVRLCNGDGAVGGGLYDPSARRQATSPFAALSAAGAINNAQTLAQSVQTSIFASGRALHAVR